MSEYIENKPVSCLYCGFYPIMGHESQTRTAKGIVVECRWICDRCGSLVRVDEKVVPEDVKT